MGHSEISAFSQFLNYGGLGLLAILCFVVLGYNAWSLNRLVATADPARVSAARPLLLGQMAVSLIGLIGLAGGGIYLDQLKVEDNKKRTAQILIDPWENDLDDRFRPNISLSGQALSGRPISIICTPGSPATVTVDFDKFIRYRISKADELKRSLPSSLGLATVEP